MVQPRNLITFYEVFREISTLIHASTTVSEVLEVVVWKVAEMLDAKGALLRIVNLETDEMDLVAAHGLSEEYFNKGLVSSHSMITDLCRRKKVIVIDDIFNDPRVQYPQEAWEEGIQMMVDVPLMLRDNVVGIIRAMFSEKRTFAEEQLDFLTAIAQQSACAIDKARMFEEQQLRYDHLALHTEKLSALGRMSAGIAHEINNPLSSILLYSSNLRKKVPEDSPMREPLEIIVHETIRCRSIIQDLLEFSREKEPNRIQAQTRHIIEKVLSLLENEFRLSRISVEKDLSDAIPENLVDVSQLQQVLVNLMLNAVEAMEGGGVITIRTRLDPAHQFEIIEISDTGPGIAPDDLPKIFEPFFSTKPKGSGLGLAVSHGIIRNHQGTIQVDSEPGKGTRFTIKIPTAHKTSPLSRED
jgi:signal transduction histidine kinase